ncbi:putative reverse transcriptase domain-containing protein [Tanacetum coccineum]
MDTELWIVIWVKNNDMATYTQRFQELTMMCTKMVPEEEDRVEKFIGGTYKEDLGLLATNYQGTPGPNQRVITCLSVEHKNITEGFSQSQEPKYGEQARVLLYEAKKAYVLRGTFCGDANRDVSYAVELADRRTSETNTMLRGCTLGLLGYLFNIDLMPIDLGSFDVIIGMDWLAKNHAVIVYDEKIPRLYVEKGCSTILGAGYGGKKNKDKSKEKRLEDVPTVRDFLEFFPKDLPGLPPIRQVEFQIDLVPSDALL